MHADILPTLSSWPNPLNANSPLFHVNRFFFPPEKSHTRASVKLTLIQQLESLELDEKSGDHQGCTEL